MVLMSLFSIFDPTSYLGVSFNWFILFMVVGVFICKYYSIISGYSGVLVMIKGIVSGMFSEVVTPNYRGIVFMGGFTFLYLAMSNLFGLFPFVFTLTAHPIVTLGLGGVAWASFFFMGWSKGFKNSVAHLVPEGSPIYLSPVMVIIESVSHLIRPFTLSIRLVANMMAGHLIVSLLASVSLMGFTGLLSSVLIQSVLLILEFGVCVIQGFVFSILLLLYAIEYY